MTLTSFFSDPGPEQHIPKAFEGLCTFFERVAGVSLKPLVEKLRGGANVVVKDDELRMWFDEFFAYCRKSLVDLEYARSDEAKAKRHDLRGRWRKSMEEGNKWRDIVEDAKSEWRKIGEGLKGDMDLTRLIESQRKLGVDLKNRLKDAKSEVESGVQQAVEEATWFWQDLFKVYMPRVLSRLKNVPIPRYVSLFRSLYKC